MSKSRLAKLPIGNEPCVVCLLEWFPKIETCASFTRTLIEEQVIKLPNPICIYIYIYIYTHTYMYTYVYIYICNVYTHTHTHTHTHTWHTSISILRSSIGSCRDAIRPTTTSGSSGPCGRFPKFHRVFLGRDPGTLKSDIVSKKHPQLICADLRLSN